MPFSGLSDSDRRQYCKQAIESLEHWLRRLIDDTFRREYGDKYIDAQDDKGSSIINSRIRKSIDSRLKGEPDRYLRPIDALLLEDTIDIICNPMHYNRLFRDALHEAFPNGNAEARTFMERLIGPRNCLSHANPISVRQMEQVICYSHDIVDSLKNYYVGRSQAMLYNVPMIIKVIDSFGNVVFPTQQRTIGARHSVVLLDQDPKLYLHPGDILTVEVEVDENFDKSSYDILWEIRGRHQQSDPPNRLTLLIENSHVGETLLVCCYIITHNDWHRFSNYCDDKLELLYKVLPPPQEQK